MAKELSDFLLREEREVVLNISDADTNWSAYCSSPKMMKKFEKAGWECVKVDKDSDGLIVAKTYSAPLEQISIKPKKKKRELTEEQMELLKQRAKAMQEAKNKK